METDVKRPLERPENSWEDDIRKDMKKLKIKKWSSASRIAIIGNYMLRGPKYSAVEVVAPEEEEVRIYGKLQDLILFFKIPMGRRKKLFEIYRESGEAQLKNVRQPWCRVS